MIPLSNAESSILSEFLKIFAKETKNLCVISVETRLCTQNSSEVSIIEKNDAKGCINKEIKTKRFHETD